MNTNIKSINVLFLTGYWLLCCIALVLIIASLSFFAGIGIGPWQLPLSFILTGSIFFFLNRKILKDNSVFLKSLIYSLLIFACCIFISLVFYDISYDGQTYHMEGIYRLKNGWNPFFSNIPDDVDLSIFINHYSKGAEIPQATLYSLIGKIEVSKATNFILLIASFLLTLSYLLSLNTLSKAKCILISFIAAFNPITINQLISTYVDGQLSTLLLCLLISILWVIKNANYSNLILLASVIIISCNVKFTGLVYVSIFLIAFLGWLIFVKKNILKRSFLTILIAGTVAVVIVGYNPYIINTTKHQHPFYPLMGHAKVDIMTKNLPNGFQSKNAIEKFFRSLLARTDNVMNTGKKVQLKIPFTINKTDIANAPKIDTRIAGFGPLYSGIILLSAFLLIIYALQSREKRYIIYASYLIAIILFSALINPESWWARYIPQVWYIPIIILVILESFNKNKFKIFKTILYACLILNISFTFIGIAFNFLMSRAVDYQLERLKTSKQPVKVQWNTFNINRVRFEENNISYVESDLSKEINKENVIRSTATFIIPNPVNSHKSIFVRWSEKL